MSVSFVILHTHQVTLILRVSYCMVCAYVWEDNPIALASGLSPVYAHNHTITALLHQHAYHCALCAL